MLIGSMCASKSSSACAPPRLRAASECTTTAPSKIGTRASRVNSNPMPRARKSSSRRAAAQAVSARLAPREMRRLDASSAAWHPMQVATQVGHHKLGLVVFEIEIVDLHIDTARSGRLQSRRRRAPCLRLPACQNPWRRARSAGSSCRPREIARSVMSARACAMVGLPPICTRACARAVNRFFCCDGDFVELQALSTSAPLRCELQRIRAEIQQHRSGERLASDRSRCLSRFRNPCASAARPPVTRACDLFRDNRARFVGEIEIGRATLELAAASRPARPEAVTSARQTPIDGVSLRAKTPTALRACGSRGICNASAWPCTTMPADRAFPRSRTRPPAIARLRARKIQRLLRGVVSCRSLHVDGSSRPAQGHNARSPAGKLRLLDHELCAGHAELAETRRTGCVNGQPLRLHRHRRRIAQSRSSSTRRACDSRRRRRHFADLQHDAVDRRGRGPPSTGVPSSPECRATPSKECSSRRTLHRRRRRSDSANRDARKLDRGGFCATLAATSKSWVQGAGMGAKRALIVDDSKSARLFLSRILVQHAIEVETVESAEAGHRLPRRPPPGRDLHGSPDARHGWPAGRQAHQEQSASPPPSRS